MQAGSALEQGFYVRPALVEMRIRATSSGEKPSPPILSLLKYRELREAIALQNDVAQGLSWAIFTSDMREAAYFLSASRSDCGIANVNIGTSAAEIEGAFSGEKGTGGGREASSDAWKQSMRRATNNIHEGTGVPLAQGVSFELA